MLVNVYDKNWKAICKHVGHNEEQAETRYHLLLNLEKEKVKLKKKKERFLTTMGCTILIKNFFYFTEPQYQF
jgi:hypothetical protein